MGFQVGVRFPEGRPVNDAAGAQALAAGLALSQSLRHLDLRTGRSRMDETNNFFWFSFFLCDEASLFFGLLIDKKVCVFQPVFTKSHPPERRKTLPARF